MDIENLDSEEDCEYLINRIEDETVKINKNL